MAPLALERDDLGSKHYNYNQLLKKAIADGVKSEDLNPDENDLDNLLKIDIANRQKNVAYTLEVLKSEDMLYVSRAIKHSAWLVTERQYTHIINPEYLHTQLFPQMTTKASLKLMLHIRLKLKDEDRIDEFYKYYKKNDPKKAQKWLPQCSLALIKEELKKDTGKIQNHIFKRLSERGFAVFKQALDTISYWEIKKEVERVMFLLKTDTECFLNTLENLQKGQMPKFGPKATEFIMKKYPQKFQNNFEKYADCIHLPTFAKLMKKEEIKDFMLMQLGNNNLVYWCNYENIKILVKHMPKEGKFEFVKQFFIEKPFKDPPIAIPYHMASVFTDNRKDNIYRWYCFAPFDVAFPELKKLIRLESSPSERKSMLSVILLCAKRNPQHVQELLQYYHDKHMNEPLKFKIPLVNKILSQTNTHNYDEKTWTLLNSIFYSMEVYSETGDNNVQPYIEAIIAYKVLHDEKVPEIVAKKFIFNSMEELQRKLEVEEKTKIFNYLYNTQITRIRNKAISSHTQFNETLELLDDVMSVLLDWKRDILDFPEILDKIRELIKIKQENGWDMSMSTLYSKNKKWRKVMFEESLALSISEESLINAIKHDPTLLLRHNAEVESLRYNDNVTLTRLLRKLRVYFSQSMTNEWTTDYIEKLNQTKGLKALTRAICILLPEKPLMEILQKYAPTETKVNWSEDDEHLLSLRKYLAKNMHLARPLVFPNIVLCYARGDYLQFALPSLSAVSYNISSERSHEMLSKMLEAPVSVQKHGITLAFNKLQPKEIKQLFADLWERNNNASIRARIFKRIFELLCKEKNDEEAEQIWDLLSTFIDNLSPEEDSTIYRILGNSKNSVDMVPLCVRGKFCMKSYKYLTSFPHNSDRLRFANDMKFCLITVMEYLDFDFITDVVQKDLEDFTKLPYCGNMLPSYLLRVKDEEAQTQRYNRIFLPLLDRCLPLWEETVEDGNYVVKRNMTNVLQELLSRFVNYVFMNKMVLPVKLFADIANNLEEKLPTKTTYILLRTWKLSATLVKLLDEHRGIPDAAEMDTKHKQDHYFRPGIDDRWNPFFLTVTKDLAQACINYLKEDLAEYFPSINLIFAEALRNFGSIMHFMVYFKTLNNIIDNCDKCPKCFIMVLRSFSYWGDEAKDIVEEIRNKIESHPSVEVKMYFYRDKVTRKY